MLPLILLGLLLAGFLVMLSRAGELFYISVRDGKLLVVRGRVPVSMLQEFRDAVNQPTVRRGSIRAFRTASGGQLSCSGDISDGREQRMRNTFMLYPAAQLRAAPPLQSPTIGQVAGIAWLAWMMDRR